MQIKSLFIGCLSLLMMTNILHAQGIQFAEGSWDEIKAKAKKENKYIFVDAYAVWCGPCKWMAKNTFTDEEVGKVFNEKFINYKFDMEKGDGPDFAKKYNVKAYPTLVFFNPKGEMVYKTVGAKQVEDLLNDHKTALDPNKQMTTLAQKFEKGEKDTDFLYNYVVVLSDAYESAKAKEVAEIYLKEVTQKNWTSEKSFEVISLTMADYTTETFKYVANHKKDFTDAVGAEKVEGFIASGIMGGMYPIAREQDEAKYNKFKEDVKKLMAEDAPKYIALLDMQYYSRSDDAEKYMLNYYDNYCDNSNQLNSIAWRYFEQHDDKAKLEKALNWANKSVELNANWANLDTKANLLNKLGRQKEALAVAQEAVKMGKEQGADVTETEKLAEAIKKDLGVKENVAPKEDGIAFAHGSWDEIKAQAKKENKYIFVDAYAVWCGPCKWMAANVFTDASVGEHFNANFVSYKFDMEKGEGPAFAKEHGVAAYPTLLFFSPEGELVHKAVGAQPVDQLIAESKNALDPKKQIFSLQKKYKEGERDPQFLYNYTMALAGAYEDASEPAELYLNAIKKEDWSKEENFELIMTTQQNYKSDVVKYVIENKDAFAKENGKDLVNRFIQMVLYSQMMLVVESQDKDAYKALKKDISELAGDEAALYNALLDYQFHLDSKKAFKYQKVYFDNHCDNWSELNEIAWFYFENESSKKKLKKALDWANRSIDLQKHWFNLDTKANLLFKLKRYKEAKTTAEEALELCKEAGDDTEASEELLKNIKEAMGA
jgi:thiol-disulfide isomerase/thioredoxin